MKEKGFKERSNQLHKANSYHSKKEGEKMFKLKVAEIITQIMIYVGGFFATCLENQNYIAIIAALLSCSLIATLVGKAIKSITNPKRL